MCHPAPNLLQGCQEFPPWLNYLTKRQQRDWTPRLSESQLTLEPPTVPEQGLVSPWTLLRSVHCSLFCNHACTAMSRSHTLRMQQGCLCLIYSDNLKPLGVLGAIYIFFAWGAYRYTPTHIHTKQFSFDIYLSHIWVGHDPPL